ncbi:MAG: hypothetical protein ABIM42_06735 [candidate division WOR-3 bacterium]
MVEGGEAGTYEMLDEAIKALPFESRIVEFKTFVREKSSLDMHAHLFEPSSVSSLIITASLGFDEKRSIRNLKSSFFIFDSTKDFLSGSLWI